jgi:hypothetical protein
VSAANQISPSYDGEKSAEVIVVGETSRSANEHSKVAGWFALAPLTPCQSAVSSSGNRKGVLHSLDEGPNQ